MEKLYVLMKSRKTGKKWDIITPAGKVIHFGSADAQDYTQHKNPLKMEKYLIRHKKRESWGKNGINTPGFWARWLLWSHENMQDAIDYIEKKFDIQILMI